MVNRRNVLKLGAAGLAGVLVGHPTRAVGAERADSDTTLCRAVFDERFEDCLAFANELGRKGFMTAGVRGDVAKLWYEDLRVRLRQRRVPIAGLTDRVALFCLEELARDVGMKVSIRVDHLIDRNGYVQHDAIGPASLVEATRKLKPNSDFGRAMAVLASQYAMSEPRGIAAQKRTGPLSPANHTALVTWVIA